MQSRLLRVLQEKVIEPLGSVRPVKVNVRTIAATNRDLGNLVKIGEFRNDLYYRINVFALKLPLLRDRREDVPILIEHFISQFNRLQGKNVTGVAEHAMKILLNHDYPGKVRGLESIVEHAFILCHESFIEPRHLPLELAQSVGIAFGEDRQGMSLKDREAVHILDAVHRHDGNRSAAAREWGINPSTLFRKVKAFGIELPPQGGHRHTAG